ncbi:MAG: hypothetical protein M3P98_00605 [bacterium]|nr:hypothetical protein [bacterium]
MSGETDLQNPISEANPTISIEPDGGLDVAKAMENSEPGAVIDLPGVERDAAAAAQRVVDLQQPPIQPSTGEV